MSVRIGYYVHHHGAGHLTRARLIAAALHADGAQVCGFSSMPRPDDWPGDWVDLPLDEIDDPSAGRPSTGQPGAGYTERTGQAQPARTSDGSSEPAAVPPTAPAAGAPPEATAVDPTATGTLHWAPLNSAGYRRRMDLVARGCADLDVLVSDVSVEIATLARLLGVPVVVVAMRGDRSDRPHRLAYDLATQLVAFWPGGAPEPNWPAQWRHKAVPVGLLSRFDPLVGADPGRPPVGADSGTPPVGADPGMPLAVADSGTSLAGAGPDTSRDVAGSGTFPGEDVTPDDFGRGSAFPVDHDPPGSDPRPVVSVLWGHGGQDWTALQRSAVRAATPDWRWQWAGRDADVLSSLQRADVVVAHAGEAALGEIAALRKPAVIVATSRPHGEQEATVAALSEAGSAVTCTALPELSTWSGLLEQARSLGGDGWVRWSDGRGADRAARVIRGVAQGQRYAGGTAVVVIVAGRHDHLRGQLAGLAAGSVLPERVFIVAMGDAQVADVVREATAGTGLIAQVTSLRLDAAGDAGESGQPRLPLARARNLGARIARESGCEAAIFFDVDCIPGQHTVRRYVHALGNASPTALPDMTHATAGARPTIWSGPVTYLPPRADGSAYRSEELPALRDPHPARPDPAPGERREADDVRLFWSLSFAVLLDDLDLIGGFDERYTGYGGEDTDLAMRLQRAGGRLVWLGGADAYHQYHPTTEPPVQHLHDIIRNANLFADTWGWHPMQGWLQAFDEAGLAHLDPVTHRWTVNRTGIHNDSPQTGHRDAGQGHHPGISTPDPAAR